MFKDKRELVERRMKQNNLFFKDRFKTEGGGRRGGGWAERLERGRGKEDRGHIKHDYLAQTDKTRLLSID